MKTSRVLWPVICMATRSEIPALTMFRTAVRRRSCFSFSRHPACSHAFYYGLRISFRCTPYDARRSEGMHEGSRGPVPAPWLAPTSAGLPGQPSAPGSGKPLARLDSWSHRAGAGVSPLQSLLDAIGVARFQNQCATRERTRVAPPVSGPGEAAQQRPRTHELQRTWLSERQPAAGEGRGVSPARPVNMRVAELCAGLRAEGSRWRL